MRKKNSQGTLSAYDIRPDEVQAGDIFGYKVVAAVWPNGQGWCAFRGPTDWEDHRVVEAGDMVSNEVAEGLFPTLAYSKLQYLNY